jgi:hypothetical protein
MAEGKAKIGCSTGSTITAQIQDAERESTSTYSRRPITDEYIRVWHERVPTDKQGRTFGELIVEALFQRAIEGEVQAIKEITDRIEGRVALTRQVRQSEERGELPVIRVIYDRAKPTSEVSPIAKVAG